MARLKHIICWIHLIVTGFSLLSGQTFGIQGVLRDQLGDLVADGNYDLTFRLYETETGGSAIWTETISSVPVLHGVFSDDLGDISSFSSISFDRTYWLGISINGGSEMTPRSKFTNSPYTMAVIGADNLFPSSGNVGIGTKTPHNAVTVTRSGAAHVTLNSDGDDDNGLTFLDQGSTKWDITHDQSDNTLYVKDDSGNTALAVTSNGDVGIGTTSPESRLHVQGSPGDVNLIVDGQIRSNNNDGGLETGAAGLVGGLETNKLGIANGGDWRVTVDTNGKVGIGTTTPAQNLDVAGDLKLSSGVIKFSDGTELTTADLGTVCGSLGTDGELVMGADSDGNGSGEIQFQTNGSTAMTVTSNGRLGVGTTTPAYGLDVAGDIGFSGTLKQNGETFQSGVWELIGSDMHYSSGNVGIGTDTPDYALDVAGTVNATDLLVNGEPFEVESPWYGGPTTISWDGGINMGAYIDDFWDFGTTMVNDACLNNVRITRTSIRPVTHSSGSIGSTSYPFNNVYFDHMYYYGAYMYSDRRLKQNFRSIDNPLDLIMKLNPVRYDINVETHPYYSTVDDHFDFSTEHLDNNLGFVAQELQEVLPMMVTTEHLSKLLQITNHHQMIPVVTEAISEMKTTELDEMEQQIQEMERMLDDLEGRK